MMIELPQRCLVGRVNPKWFARVRPLYLNYTGSDTLYNFQVKCTLSPKDIPFERLRPDKRDLLFLDNNNEAIPYFIGEANSSEIVLWLKFEQVKRGREIFWLYFGNSHFEGLSNGYEVFEFFDHFPGNALDTNKWWIQKEEGEVTVSNSILKLAGGSDWTFVNQNETQYNPSLEEHAFELRVRTGEEKYLNVGLDERSKTGSASDLDRATLGYGDDGKIFLTQRFDSESHYSRSTSADNFRLFTIIPLSDKVIFRLDEEEVIATENPPGHPLGFRFEVRNSGNFVEIDWVGTRRYSDPEPVVEI